MATEKIDIPARECDGVCIAHGTKKPRSKRKTTCNHEGCSTFAVNGGVCTRHGANNPNKNICNHDGCTNFIQKGGVCWKHGAKEGAKVKTCNHEGCTNQAQRKGVCVRHGAVLPPRKLCSQEGCTNQAQRKGVCFRHGAKHTIGCPACAQKGGACNMHGGKDTCSQEGRSHEGCTNQAKKGEVCRKHGANQTQKSISHEGTTNYQTTKGAEPSQPLPNDNTHQRLMLSGTEVDGLLVEERLRWFTEPWAREELVRDSLIQDLKAEMLRRHARESLIRDLEAEMSRRHTAKEALLRSTIDMLQKRETTLVAPPASNHTFVQGGELQQGCVSVDPPSLSRMVTPAKRHFPGCEDPNERQISAIVDYHTPHEATASEVGEQEKRKKTKTDAIQSNDTSLRMYLSKFDKSYPLNDGGGNSEGQSDLGRLRSMSDPNLSVYLDDHGLLHVDGPEGWVGAYTPKNRQLRINRFLEKRNRRLWAKTVKYDVRKNFADSRLRVKGRFVKKEDETLVRELTSLT